MKESLNVNIKTILTRFHTFLTLVARRTCPYETRSSRAQNQIMITYFISFTKTEVKYKHWAQEKQEDPS